MTITNADDSASLSNDAIISSGETAYFVIKGVVTHLEASAGNDWIQVSLDNLDAGSAAANIVWEQNDSTTDMQELLLDYSSVDGIKINEVS